MPKSRIVSQGLQALASKLERVGSEPEMRQQLCQLPEAMLRGDWLEALRAAGLGEPRLPVFLERMSIVVAAPPTFWAAARHADASRNHKRNAPSLGRCLGELESALSHLGFWVLLVRLEVLQSRRGLPFRFRPWLESVPAA